MGRKRLYLLAPIIIVVFTVCSSLTVFVEAAPQFHFAISGEFLNTLASDDRILRTMRITMDARSAVHTLATDCELHVAGTIQHARLGQPSGMVVDHPADIRPLQRSLQVARIAAILKLYTLPQLDSDSWLAAVMQNGFGTEPKVLHGLFTYDFDSTIRPLRGSNNQLTRPSQGADRLSFGFRGLLRC